MIASSNDSSPGWGVGIPVLVPRFNPETDFTPIGLVGRYAFCLFVHPDVPAKTVAEFVDHARANPDKLNFATGNLTEFMFAAQLMKSTGITMLAFPTRARRRRFPT